MLETPNVGGKTAPETGGFFARDRQWHPPPFTPPYKTTVLRSPRKALLSLDATISEITGPVFGYGMIGELDDDLIHNSARPGEAAIAVSGRDVQLDMHWGRNSKQIARFSGIGKVKIEEEMVRLRRRMTQLNRLFVLEKRASEYSQAQTHILESSGCKCYLYLRLVQAPLKRFRTRPTMPRPTAASTIAPGTGTEASDERPGKFVRT